MDIVLFERSPVVGGRIATVEVAGEASILHPKNLPSTTWRSSGFAIWDGCRFVFKTISSQSTNWAVQKAISCANTLLLFLRYLRTLLRMESFAGAAVDKFLRFYESRHSRPVFETVEEMLRWAGLYGLTASTLDLELASAGLSPLLVNELVTVISAVAAVNIARLILSRFFGQPPFTSSHLRSHSHSDSAALHSYL